MSIKNHEFFPAHFVFHDEGGALVFFIRKLMGKRKIVNTRRDDTR